MENKWHILKGIHPVCWDNKIVDFDDKDSADVFLNRCYEVGLIPNDMRDLCISNIFIEFDGERIDGTRTTINFNSSGEPYLEKY